MNLRAFFLVSLLGIAFLNTEAAGNERPNFVWIVSEDNSIHYLRHFFEGGAETPAIERLASEGLTYRNAFSNAPVCSVARTTLATMCYAPRIGTQFHRRYVKAPMPEGAKLVSQWLKEAGYYTTNKSKTDYNVDVQPSEAWNESSNKATWRNRPDSAQPFFHMESHAASHESSLHFKKRLFESGESNHSPQDITLAPYHPDTELFRFTHAVYLDKQQSIDAIVAETVDKLRQDGLLESTFIFYFGDHGGVLPRGKGYVYESGLHVPLVIRIPEKFRDQIGDFEIGSDVEGFVSFVDFGPTLLHLAGLEQPENIDGQPFLGSGLTSANVNSRDEAFGYADRMDERYEFVRSYRKGRYHYIRSFQPWLPDGLNNNYRFKMLAYAQWRDKWRSGELDAARSVFFESKPIELLFDCETDPHEIRNLASNQAYSGTLQDLRSRLGARMRSMPDLSFYPESYLAKHAMTNPTVFGQTQREAITQLADIADLAFADSKVTKKGILDALASANPMHRMWGAMTVNAMQATDNELLAFIQSLQVDSDPIVRLRAIETLGRVGRIDPRPGLFELINTTEDPIVATEALNSLVWFRDHFAGKYPVRESDLSVKTLGADVEDRLLYLFGKP